MKHTVLGFQQEKLIANDLDLIDALILSTLRDVALKFEKRIIKGKEFFWYKQGVLFKEIPIVGSEKTLDRRLDKLEEKGFISQEQKNSKKILNKKTKKNETKKGTFKYFRVNEKVFELLDYQGLERSDTSEGVDKMSSEGVDKMSSEGVDKMSSQRPSLLNLYPSFKDDDDTLVSTNKKESSIIHIPIDEILISKFKKDWKSKTGKDLLIILDDQKRNIMSLVEKHSYETVLTVMSKIIESDYLIKNINIDLFLEPNTFVKIANDRYKNRTPIEPNEEAKVTPKTNKFTQINEHGHNWDMNHIEQLEQEYIERQVQSEN